MCSCRKPLRYLARFALVTTTQASLLSLASIYPEFSPPSNQASPVKDAVHVEVVVVGPLGAPKAVGCGHGSFSSGSWETWCPSSELHLGLLVRTGEAAGVWTHPPGRNQGAGCRERLSLASL